MLGRRAPLLKYWDSVSSTLVSSDAELSIYQTTNLLKVKNHSEKPPTTTVTTHDFENVTNELLASNNVETQETGTL